MKLGVTDLIKAKLASITPSAKQAIHIADWSDRCDVTDMGAGPTTIVVTGFTYTELERLAIMAACDAARQVETFLYFPSELGETDDRYYSVKTGPMIPGPINASMWSYSFNCITTPYPYIYDAATGERVT